MVCVPCYCTFNNSKFLFWKEWIQHDTNNTILQFLHETFRMRSLSALSMSVPSVTDNKLWHTHFLIAFITFPVVFYMHFSFFFFFKLPLLGCKATCHAVQSESMKDFTTVFVLAIKGRINNYRFIQLSVVTDVFLIWWVYRLSVGISTLSMFHFQIYEDTHRDYQLKWYPRE